MQQDVVDMPAISFPGSVGPSAPSGQMDPLLAALLANIGGGSSAAMPQTLPAGLGGPASQASPAGMVPQGMSGISPEVLQEAAGGGQDLDLFQRVAKLLTDNPMWIMLFAGMGLKEALEKSGKYKSQPHRSNMDLASQGYDVKSAGQVGMPAPGELQRQTMPVMPPGAP